MYACSCFALDEAEAKRKLDAEAKRKADIDTTRKLEEAEADAGGEGRREDEGRG